MTGLTPLLDALVTPMAEVEALIITKSESIAPLIPEISRHLITAGGKRIRPLLLVATARLFNPNATPYALAAAVEFIHTATLLHDDVVDASNTRRNKPSANALWNNKAPVLVGDFLFSRAFQLMVQANDIAILKVLADTANTIAEGEVLQLAAQGNVDLTEAQYLEIINAKTAVLFAAALEVGGRAGGADTTTALKLHQAGACLGMAFQLLDDALDYDGDAAHLGKTIGNDFFERKMTLPLLLALNRATHQDRTTLINNLRGKKTANFVEVCGILQRTGTLEETRARASSYSQQALDILAAWQNTPLGDALRTAVAFLATRST
ncbi:MAG: polyprenyl synthetase family protein [Holosporales bacterium]|jgi:octaprenyl-diphosphate synthase